MQPADPVALEAESQALATATFRGRVWRVPADVDLWPLDLILHAPTLNQFGEPVINYPALFAALKLLLVDQWRLAVQECPKRTDLVELSNELAAAVGFPANQPLDRVFGALPMTLALITKWPSKVESDLQRFWHLDYVNRFRFDSAGHRLLSIRKIHTCLSNLPGDSALAIALGKRTGSELLLMDLFKAIAKVDHPARPLTPAEAARARSEQSELAKARAQYADRRTKDSRRRTGAAEIARRNGAERMQREKAAAHA